MGPDRDSERAEASSSSPDEAPVARRIRIRRSNLAVTLVALVALTLLALTARFQSLSGDPLAEPPSLASFQGFFYPIERNRFLRPDPTAEGAKTPQHDLHAVSFSLNGERGWAVGREGTLLQTTNGGRSWTLKSLSVAGATRATAGPKRSSLQVVSSAHAEMPGKAPPGPGLDPDAVTSAVVQRPLNLPPESQLPPLPNVQQKLPDLPARPGVKEMESPVAVPDQKQLPLSNGDGAPLKPGPIPPAPILGAPPAAPLHFNDVHFLADGKRGWVVGTGPVIMHTRDGGATWERQTAGVTTLVGPQVVGNNLNAVAFDANGQSGWIAGFGGDILTTNDGGKRWERIESGTRSSLYAIAVMENGLGWAVGERGAIVHTRDRGRKWQAHGEPFRTNLRSIAAPATGQRAVAVGDGGIIVTTADSGATWQQHSTRAENDLSSVLFTPTGQLGWAVGAGGTVLRTQDGAAKWIASAVPPRTKLKSVAFADDGRHGVIVGDAFTILTTRDGGSTWHRATHQRFPAPWFYVAGVLLLAWLGIRYYRNWKHSQEDDSVASIIDKGESDEPIVRVEQDRLGFGLLVKGLSGYLRNRATVPPLTIAISAPWGGGKSSLMSMLRTEMREVGVRSVWFNAWHHQKEEVMLASLLESIRAQALPFWLTPEGITFRAKLLWRRSRNHPFFAFVACCTLLLAGWHVIGATTEWADDKSKFEGGWVEYVAQTISTIWDAPEVGAGADRHLLDKLFDGKVVEFAVSSMSNIFGRPEMLLNSVELVVLAATVVMVLLYGLRSFPGSPGVLLASVANQFKIAQVQAQTSYRQRFRKHFQDVCEALRPRTMLIFIDDLDRCEPAKTAEMLEAINYLANSGSCFIVVGMARDIVEAQLSIYFDKVADAHTIAEAEADAADGDISVPPKIPGSTRIHYVQSYLRKLINLEIHIPELTKGNMYSLLGVEDAPKAAQPQDEDSRSRTRKIADVLERTWQSHAPLITSAVLVLAAIGLVVYVQAGIKDWDAKRVARIGDERKSANERLEKIRDAEQRATVALDFARGKEKRIATRLFERYKVAVAGLEFRLPLGEFPAVKGSVAELCKDDLPPGGVVRDPSDVEQSMELACWRRSANATRAVEQRLNDIKGSVAAAGMARAHDAFDRIARELAKAKKMADEAEHIAGTVRDVSTIAPTTMVASSPPTALAQPKDAATDGVRETEHVTWPYGLMLALLFPGALYVLTRREPYVIKDEPYFRDALRLWSPLLGSESAFTVPREVKRFQNRARFYAMRLRKPAPRGHWYDRLVNRFEGWEEKWQTRTH